MVQSISQKRVRNYGVDILKILSMYMVLLLHIQKFGILSNVKRDSTNFYVCYFIEIAAYCAVDVFGMLSGYLIINSKWRLTKIIPLWLSVFYHHLIITLLFMFIPYFSKLHKVNFTDKKAIFFPALSNYHWYFTEYFGLYFFIPYLNDVLHHVGKKKHEMLILSIVSLFTLFPLIYHNKVDIFKLNGGYSVWWLGCLYIIGAYLKLYPVKLSKIISFIIYLFSVILVWLSVIYRSKISLLGYNSFFILLSGVSLVTLFIQIEINNKTLQKLIALGSSLSFGVYIIHTHPIIKSAFLINKFKVFTKDPYYLMALKIIGTTISLYLLLSFIDYIRYFLFKLLKVNSLPKIVDNLISKIRKYRKQNTYSEIDEKLLDNKLKTNEEIENNTFKHISIEVPTLVENENINVINDNLYSQTH